MFKPFKRALLVVACAMPAVASAQIEFRGFATLGGGIFSEDDATIAGVDDSFSTEPYTRFALQAKAEVNDRTDFTAQLIARGTEDFAVDAEWAYVTIDVTESLDFRVGRFRSPLFFYSDYLDVGYAYPWVRPPIDLYRLTFSTVDGVDIVYDQTFGNWSGSFQAYFGGFDGEVFFNGFTPNLELENFGGLNYSLSNDWLTLRASYNIATGTLETPGDGALLLAGLRAEGNPVPGAAEVADALEFRDEDAAFWGLGYSIDQGRFISAAEYTVLEFDEQSFISDDTSWYVMAGVRFGDFTVHVTGGEQSGDPDYSFLNAIPNVEAFEEVREQVFNAVDNDQDTYYTLGLRYDYGPSSAFKIQLTNIEYETENVDGTLVSFSYDVVF